MEEHDALLATRCCSRNINQYTSEIILHIRIYIYIKLYKDKKLYNIINLQYHKKTVCDYFQSIDIIKNNIGCLDALNLQNVEIGI